MGSTARLAPGKATRSARLDDPSRGARRQAAHSDDDRPRAAALDERRAALTGSTAMDLSSGDHTFARADELGEDHDGAFEEHDHELEPERMGAGPIGAPDTEPDASEDAAQSSAGELPPFPELISSAVASALPDDLRCTFEATHFIDLRAVRVYHVPALREHGVAGLCQGVDIALADSTDVETLAHELGHVVDSTLSGGASANAKLGQLEVSDDAQREERANQLVKGADATAPAGERHAALRQPARGGAAQPRLTKRSAISTNVNRMNWKNHRTQATAGTDSNGSAVLIAQGSGATLSSQTALSYTARAANNQLEHLTLTISPEYVDGSRSVLPAPRPHVDGHLAGYVLPSAMLGSAVPENQLYVPQKELVALQSFQKDMTAAASKAPGKLVVDTTFGADGLANTVTAVYQALDPVTSAPTHTLRWAPQFDTNRVHWSSTSSKSKRTPHTATGGAPTQGQWSTEIVWAPANGDNDGVKMTANKLGPDHPLGSTPDCAVAKTRVKALEAAAGNNEEYVAGHLLNDHLGGPGDLSANLAPIPKKANSQMSANVETKAKELVNDNHGWVFYEVTIAHQRDAIANLNYPSQVKAELAALDSSGAKTNPQTVTIDIDAPSLYAASTASDPVASGSLTNAAIQTSPVMLDEVVLTHQNDLRPYLRSSAEIFELVSNSEISVAISTPDHAAAWNNVLRALRTFEKSTRMDLDLLGGIKDAIEVWDTAAPAPALLNDTTVRQVQTAVANCLAAAEASARSASAYLVAAKAAVKKNIEPSDLFRNQDLFGLLAGLLENAGPALSIAAALRAQTASSLPSRKHARDNAVKNHDQAAAKAAATFATDFKKSRTNNNHQQPPATPSSPVSLFDEFEIEASEMEVAALGGFELHSARADKVRDALGKLISSGNAAALSKYGTDPKLAKSERASAVLTMARFAAECVKNKTADAKTQSAAMLLLTDSLQALASDDPEMILQLITVMKIK